MVPHPSNQDVKWGASVKSVTSPVQFKDPTAETILSIYSRPLFRRDLQECKQEVTKVVSCKRWKIYQAYPISLTLEVR